MGSYAFFGMDGMYTATASMYVLARQDDEGANLNTNLTASQMVANDVATLLQSDRVRDLAARDLGVKSLAGYEISVTSETTSRVLSVTVTSDNPQSAAALANSLAEHVSDIAQDVMGLSPSTSSIARIRRPFQRFLPHLLYCGCLLGWPIPLLPSSLLQTCSIPRFAPPMRSKSFWVSPSSVVCPK